MQTHEVTHEVTFDNCSRCISLSHVAYLEYYEESSSVEVYMDSGHKVTLTSRDAKDAKMVYEDLAVKMKVAPG